MWMYVPIYFQILIHSAMESLSNCDNFETFSSSLFVLQKKFQLSESGGDNNDNARDWPGNSQKKDMQDIAKPSKTYCVQVKFGEGFTANLDVENKSDNVRTLETIVSCCSLFYNGVPAHRIKVGVIVTTKVRSSDIQVPEVLLEYIRPFVHLFVHLFVHSRIPNPTCPCII